MPEREAHGPSFFMSTTHSRRGHVADRRRRRSKEKEQTAPSAPKELKCKQSKTSKKCPERITIHNSLNFPERVVIRLENLKVKWHRERDEWPTEASSLLLLLKRCVASLQNLMR
jgi:hypothetical protein